MLRTLLSTAAGTGCLLTVASAMAGGEPSIAAALCLALVVWATDELPSPESDN